MISESEIIVSRLSREQTVTTSSLIKDSKDKERMNAAIQIMIANNIVRYDVKGDLKWHGKVQQDKLRVID